MATSTEVGGQVAMGGHRVALLGSGFDNEPRRMERWLLKHTVVHPRILFLPTASFDSRSYIERFHRVFSALGAIPHHLTMADARRGRVRGVLDADVIYVGGGNTVAMLRAWRSIGLAELIEEAAGRGSLLSGVSAGAACWFQQYSTDSFGGLDIVDDGLGVLGGGFCPHYSSEAGRRDSFLAAARSGRITTGIGLDDEAALLIEGGLPADLLTTGRGSAWRVSSASERRIVPEPRESNVDGSRGSIPGQWPTP